MKIFEKNPSPTPSMKRKLSFSLGSIAAILALSGVLSILEYRRMSDYVSDLIAANIKSINLSQKLVDMTQEYNHQMLSVVLLNDVTLMPEYDLELFQSHADSLRKSVTLVSSQQIVDTVATSFDAYMQASMKFDEIFQSDSLNAAEWFFSSLQPCYDKFNKDINELNVAIHEELKSNSEDFDAGFYRSIIPGVVSVCAGLLLVFLLMYFILSYYVNPIYKMSAGVDNYRTYGKKYGYTFDGDDQLANINSGLIELIEDNMELKRRVSALREEKEKIIKGNN